MALIHPPLFLSSSRIRMRCVRGRRCSTMPKINDPENERRVLRRLVSRRSNNSKKRIPRRSRKRPLQKKKVRGRGHFMIERRGKGSLRLCSWEKDKDTSISIREEVLLSISVIGFFLFLSITYITFLPSLQVFPFQTALVFREMGCNYCHNPSRGVE